MPWFEGTHTETVILDVDKKAALEHFADPHRIGAHTDGTERFDVEGDTVHFVLEEENHGVFRFKGDYRSRYRVDGDRVVWTAVDGNVEQSGSAVMESLPDGKTRMDYSEKVRVDLDVPKLMAPMLKPVVAAMTAQGIQAFVKRMVEALPA